MFKKALIRIAVAAQDKLGGQQEEKLGSKQDGDNVKLAEQTVKKDKLKAKMLHLKEEEREGKDRLKQEFEEEKEKRLNALNKDK